MQEPHNRKRFWNVAQFTSTLIGTDLQIQVAFAGLPVCKRSMQVGERKGDV